MKYIKENERIWDRRSEHNDCWSVPVSSEMIRLAKEGFWSIILTPQKPVPSTWLPHKLTEMKVSKLDRGMCTNY